MTSIFLSLSGSSGGNRGPQEIYPLLEKQIAVDHFRFIPVETTPDFFRRNVDNTVSIALKMLKEYKDIYLMGYSMGAGVAALAAYTLATKMNIKVKGVILVGTQTEGISALNELKIPVLFYHGKEDEYFAIHEIKYLYEQIIGPKKLVEVQKLTHAMTEKNTSSNGRWENIFNWKRNEQHAMTLATDLLKEIADFVDDINKGIFSFKDKIIIKELSVTKKKNFLEELKDYLHK